LRICLQRLATQCVQRIVLNKDFSYCKLFVTTNISLYSIACFLSQYHNYNRRNKFLLKIFNKHICSLSFCPSIHQNPLEVLDAPGRRLAYRPKEQWRIRRHCATATLDPGPVPHRRPPTTYVGRYLQGWRDSPLLHRPPLLQKHEGAALGTHSAV